MPKDFKRSDRIGEMLQRKLALLIRTEVKDPRISGLLTITDVKVSPDFAYAKVFVTQLGSEGQEMPEVIRYLNEAAPFLRKLIGKEVKLRIIPEIKFVYDDSIAYGNRLSALINDAISKENKEDE